MGRCSGFAFAQISARDFEVAVVGQLPPPKLPFSDQFETGSVKMVGFEAAFRRGGLGSGAWKTRRETCTTP
jgi:hypothetical protein